LGALVDAPETEFRETDKPYGEHLREIIMAGLESYGIDAEKASPDK
jgi:hypothetical protein